MSTLKGLKKMTPPFGYRMAGSRLVAIPAKARIVVSLFEEKVVVLTRCSNKRNLMDE